MEPMRKSSLFVEVPNNLHIHEGDRIRVSGTIRENIHFPLSGYDRFSFLHGGYGYLYAPMFSIQENKKDTRLDMIRNYWNTIFLTGFPREVAGILIGMTIGADTYLTPAVKESFMLSGITHILVVSGSNIAFLIVFLSFFLKYLPIGRTGRILIIGGSILYYASLV